MNFSTTKNGRNSCDTFFLGISGKVIKVDARVLDPPSVTFGKNSKKQVIRCLSQIPQRPQRHVEKSKAYIHVRHCFCVF